MQDRFLHLACIGLGGLAGALITLPIAMSRLDSVGLLILFAGSSFGFLAGYRRRTSRAFLYFCILSILVLLTLLIMNTRYSVPA